MISLGEVPLRQLVGVLQQPGFYSQKLAIISFGVLLGVGVRENGQPVISCLSVESDTNCQNSLVSRKKDYQ